ncbi:cytochrome b/b6 domain-containing protein [Bacillaceae bacterium S4-13-58]
MSKKQYSGKTVKRFSKPVIFAHWLNAAAFIVLYLSALPLYTEWFDWMFLIFGGAEGARLVHRVAAVFFVLPTVFILLADPKSFFHWIKQCFTWSKNDFGFMTRFIKEFFTGNVKNMPKQDFYNGGEKFNSLLQILCAILLIGSGIVIWFPQYFGSGLIQTMYPIHSFSAALAVAVVVGHVYLSIGHPNSKISMRGMTKGDVPIEYAKEHHENWYDELMEEEKKKNSEKGA